MYGPSVGPTNKAEDFLNAIEALEDRLVLMKQLFCGGEINKEKFSEQLSEIVQCSQFVESVAEDARTLHNEMIGE